jgi:hypothetical protein
VEQASGQRYIGQLGTTAGQVGIAPVVRAVGEHDEDVLVILSGEHGVAACDTAREQRHAFVLYCAPVQGEDMEVDKTPSLDQLWL